MKKIYLILAGLMLCAGTYGQIQINTVEELAALNTGTNSLAGDYVLMNDLTIDNWTPIGGLDDNDGEGFSGTFDGNGHTIIVTGFNNAVDNTKTGLFGSIDQKGIVKNLCVAGNVNYTGSKKCLYIGGIAGVNNGLIACCASKINIKGGIQISEKKQKKVNVIRYFEDGTYGGCIAGINLGVIINCYSEGSILISGNENKSANFAGGIAGGSGQPVQSFTSTNPYTGMRYKGYVALMDGIAHCYTTASVHAKSSGNIILVRSGGIVAFHWLGVVNSVVALNAAVEAEGNGKGVNLSVSPIMTPIGLIKNPTIFYRNDMVISKYENGQEEKLGKSAERYAVNLSDTQEQSWWRYPEGLTEKQREKTFGFSFGDNAQSPWIWDNVTKRPVLYWEKNKE
jgi:hypothetical protein